MNQFKILCGLAVMCSFAVTASAGMTKKGPGATKTLTGCLQKGAEAGTYTLTNVTGGPAATNKDWHLMDAPAALNLNAHVGHKVEISGSVVGVGAATKTEHKMKTEHKTTTTSSDVKVETTKEMKTDIDRHLRVTSMKHIAATCP
jgi:hypothetical protein